MASSGRKFVLFLIFFLFVLGFIDLFIEVGENKCEMTYMYQLPQYAYIDLGSIQKQFKNYHLYVYGEGQYFQTLQLNEFNGNPVLFVPGNAGSFEQSRSLASVALLMSYSKMTHLNYFTIDYNEDLSAFSGDRLETQTKYLYYALRKITKIYSHVENLKFILVGHSIGGIIIKSLLTKPYFNPYLKNIAVVFSLATPHKHPAISFDLKMSQVYNQINNVFSRTRQNELNNINFVSIGGSYQDKIIRPDLISLNTNSKYDRVILTTAINDVWAAADHLCIVWCRQLTIKLNQIIFDLIDSDRQVFTDSVEDRQNVIDYHLKKRQFMKTIPQFQISNYTTFFEKDNWILRDDRLIRLNISKVLTTANYLIPLKERESILVHIEGLFKPDMISVCHAELVEDKLICSIQSRNLYDEVQLVPSSKVDHHLGHFDSTRFLNENYTHLVVRLKPSQTPYQILIDRYTTYVRKSTLALPSLTSSFMLGGFWNPKTVYSKLISQEQAFVNFSIENFDRIWHSFWLSVQTKSCYKSSSSFIGFAYLSLPNKDLNEFTWPFLPEKGYTNFFKLQLNEAILNESKASLLVYLEPNCGFEILVKFSFISAVSQILKHYFMLLVPIMISIVILLLSVQFSNVIYRFSFNDQELEKFKNLCKLNSASSNVGDNNPKCYLFMSFSEIMINYRYFTYCFLQIIVSSLISIFVQHWLYPSYDLLNLHQLSLIEIFAICSILFLFAYSVLFIFTLVVSTTSDYIALLVNYLFKTPKFCSKATNPKVKFNWNNLFIIFLSILLSLGVAFWIQINLHLVYLFFTVLFLSRTVQLKYLESLVGRTTSTSFISSIYPIIFFLYLVIIILHIPQTIDQYKVLMNLNTKFTFGYIKNLITSQSGDCLQSLTLVLIYLLFYYKVPRLDARLATPYSSRFQNFLNSTFILLSFLNILFGVFSFYYINYFVIATLLVISCHLIILFNSTIQNAELKVD